MTLELSRRRARQWLGADAHPTWQFEAGEALAQMPRQLIKVYRTGRLPENHHGRDELTPLLIRQADDRGLEDGRVGQKRRLDLGRVDILAT